MINNTIHYLINKHTQQNGINGVTGSNNINFTFYDETTGDQIKKNLICTVTNNNKGNFKVNCALDQVLVIC